MRDVNLQIMQLPWQAEVYNGLKRHNVLTKGRRTGGTSFAEDLCLEMLLGGKRVGWFFDTYKRLSEVWRDIVTALQPLLRQVNTNEHRIEIATDGVLQFFSCDAKLTCRGFKFDWVIVTESAHITNFKEIWEMEILPTLFDRHGRSLCESSPNGYNFHESLHELGQDPAFPDWASWQIPTSANPLIDAKEITDAKATMDEGNFRQEILAQFVTRAGAVFPMFRRDLHVAKAPEYDPELPIHLGIDFGFRTFAAGFWQVTPQGEAHCIGEYLGREEVTDRALAGVAAYGNETWFSSNGKRLDTTLGTIGCDPAGKARNVHTKRSDVDLLRDAFPAANVRYVTRPDLRDVEEGANRIRAMLLSADGKTRLFVHPRCKHHIRMFENLAYPPHKEGTEEKAAPVKDGVNDHWFDETRYMLANVVWRSTVNDLSFRP
jgi:hypothetical protein